MNNLDHQTVATPTRSVRVTTWQEEGKWYYRITVNGVNRDFGCLGHD